MEAGNCPCIKLVKVLLKKLQNDLFKVIIRALDNCLQAMFLLSNAVQSEIYIYDDDKDDQRAGGGI